jgi:hypothetical protein
MKHSDTLAAIAPALVKALSKIEGAAKTATNGGFKTKYATLETVIDASRDVLAENGLTLIQLPGACVSGVLNLETIIMHESGEWISGEMGIALGKTDPQGVGSALTYARRYAQMAALNMPAVDDDGETAMGRGGHRSEAIPVRERGLYVACKAAIEICDGKAALEAWAKSNEVSMERIKADDPEVYHAVRQLYAERLRSFSGESRRAA